MDAGPSALQPGLSQANWGHWSSRLASDTHSHKSNVILPPSSATAFLYTSLTKHESAVQRDSERALNPHKLGEGTYI